MGMWPRALLGREPCFALTAPPADGILAPVMVARSLAVDEGRLRIEISVQEIGEDLLVAMWGGTRPHIGAVGVAVPRPSLRDPAKWSATSSNFTFLGHKEDAIVREVSETLAAALRKNVVVTAGMHWDDLGPDDIDTVARLSRRGTQSIIEQLQDGKNKGASGS